MTPAPPHPLLHRLARALQGHKGELRRKRVTFLLGNDREIGRASRSLEKRVGIVPEQLGQLRAFCAGIGVELEALVLQGAGQRAGHADVDYIAHGAEIVAANELPYLDRGPDVVHALKEPSSVEAAIPSPFCRIGALHTGDFSPESGIAKLLAERQVAVFDGSCIGASGTFRIPIRASMSKFAGRVAAGWLLEHLSERDLSGRAVVVGAGNSGQATVATLLDAGVAEVHLFEDADQPARVEATRRRYAGESRVTVLGARGCDAPDLCESLTGAAGLILGVARPGHEAPRVVRLATLNRLLDPAALVVDVSIDERGAIDDPGILPWWSSQEVIGHLTSAFRPGPNSRYRALANMPRALPGSASQAHGEAVLPYLAALLALSALHGGPQEAADHLRSLSPQPAAPDPTEADDEDLLEALAQDLRNGLAFLWTGRRLRVEEVVASRRQAFAYLHQAKVPFEFDLPAAAGEAAERAVDSLRRLPEPVQRCLAVAIERSIPVTVCAHPAVDGSRVEDAAGALGVRPAQVLRCVVLVHVDGSVGGPIAALCTGLERVALERVEAALGEGEERPRLRVARRAEVVDLLQHPGGGLPLLALLAKVERILLSPALAAEERIYTSAGTEHMGMGFDTQVLLDLGGRVVDLAGLGEDAGARRAAARAQLTRVEAALEAGDDARAREAAEALGRLLAPNSTDEG
jgi:alanine dehydrogenase/prolyl-tRNA editing enzyme YbaK/EbsC (Cys-tRNA(Pro) deacylase)